MPLPRILLVIPLLSLIITSGCLSTTSQQANMTEPPLPPPIPALPTEGNVAAVDSITGMTPHSTYSGFAEPETFSLPTEYTFSSLSDSDTISLTINDDYIYRYAFISYDGNAWQQVDLTGTLSTHYITDSATASISITPANFGLTSAVQTATRNYIVTYTCDSAFQCHGGWQIRQFDVGLEEETPSWQTGLVSWWRLDGNADDSVGDNHGTVNGAIPMSTNCVSGGCYAFDGGARYIEVQDSESLNISGNSPFTIATWVYFKNLSETTSDNDPVLARKIDSDNHNGYQLRIMNGRTLLAFYDTSDTIRYDYDTKVWDTSDMNQWWHIVGVYDNSQVTHYRNGVEVDIANIGSYPISKTDSSLYIGGYPSASSTSFVNGSLDEVMIWNRALNSAEVSSLYDSFSACNPDCDGKECGPDGCGGSCGTCSAGYTCNTAGECIENIEQADYYVATNGDDSDDGSLASPFRTIQHAVEMAQPGDHIYVMAGTYYERVVFPRSGTAENPIVVEGQRGVSGEWLTVVNGGDLLSSVTWVPAPEMSQWTYKTDDILYEPFAMTVRIDGETKDIPQLDNEQDYWRILRISPDEIVTTRYNEFDVAYWDGIGAAQTYNVTTGETYLRFRYGDDPNGMELYASPGHQYHWRKEQGATFFLEDRSYIVIKGFEIDGSQNGVFLFGSDAAYNIIEENDIVNGKNRVRIADGAHSNHVRNNRMHMRMLDPYSPGAWLHAEYVYPTSATPEAYDRAVKENIYLRYKYEIGRGTSSPEDDCGVYVQEAGSDNRIYGNHVYDTLGAVEGSHTGTIYIYENEIYKISSVGSVLDGGNIAENYIYKNHFRDVNHVFRVQLNTDDASVLAKKAWFYENTVQNPEGIGYNMYFSRNSDKQDPDDVSGYPHVHIYHNSYTGSARCEINIYNIGSEILIVNNIFSDGLLVTYGGPIGVLEYNWVSDNFDRAESYSSGATNILGGGQLMWEYSPDIDFQIPDNAVGNQVLESGLDLSVPFTIEGKSFPTMPGMTPGYFDGSAPDLGALQK